MSFSDDENEPQNHAPQPAIDRKVDAIYQTLMEACKRRFRKLNFASGGYTAAHFDAAAAHIRNDGRKIDLGDIWELKLDGNSLTEIPRAITICNGLQRLIASYNQLQLLSPHVCMLTSLRVLDLDSNRIKSLPDNIGNLRLLVRLSLAGNELTTLPAAIIECVGLKELNLNGNQFHFLPREMRWMKPVERVRLGGNPWATALIKLPAKRVDSEFEEAAENNNEMNDRNNQPSSPASQRQSPMLFAPFSLKELCVRYIITEFREPTTLPMPRELKDLLVACTKRENKCDHCGKPFFGQGLKCFANYSVPGGATVPSRYVVCSLLCAKILNPQVGTLAALPPQQQGLMHHQNVAADDDDEDMINDDDY